MVYKLKETIREIWWLEWLKTHKEVTTTIQDFKNKIDNLTTQDFAIGIWGLIMFLFLKKIVKNIYYNLIEDFTNISYFPWEEWAWKYETKVRFYEKIEWWLKEIDNNIILKTNYPIEKRYKESQYLKNLLKDIKTVVYEDGEYLAIANKTQKSKIYELFYKLYYNK